MVGDVGRRLLMGGSVTAVASTAVALNSNTFAGRFLRQYWNELGTPIADAAGKPDPKQWPDRGLHLAWLGHSTVLMKIDGFTVLTDPVFSTRAGLGIGPIVLGLKRLVKPALTLRELPPIDLVLLSHAHMDHFDLPSLRRLESPRTDVITAIQTSDLLSLKDYRSVHETGWEKTVRVGPATIRGVEVKHWGARMRSDTYRGYNGYVIECGRWRVLFAGDTANTDLFRRLASSRGIHAAVMPIGAYNPWIHYHCTPEQAWRMGNEAGAEILLPVHHQTFKLSREPNTEPIERLHSVAGNATDRIGWNAIGQELHLS